MNSQRSIKAYEFVMTYPDQYGFEHTVEGLSTLPYISEIRSKLKGKVVHIQEVTTNPRFNLTFNKDK